MAKLKVKDTILDDEIVCLDDFSGKKPRRGIAGIAYPSKMPEIRDLPEMLNPFAGVSLLMNERLESLKRKEQDREDRSIEKRPQKHKKVLGQPGGRPVGPQRVARASS